MRRASRIAGWMLLLGSFAPAALAQDGSAALSASEMAAIRTKIERNWNFVPEIIEGCPRQFSLIADLESDGTVKAVELDGEMPAGQSCPSAVDAAKRAIRHASPLPIGRNIAQIVIEFDLTTIFQN